MGMPIRSWDMVSVQKKVPFLGEEGPPLCLVMNLSSLPFLLPQVKGWVFLWSALIYPKTWSIKIECGYLWIYCPLPINLERLSSYLRRENWKISPNWDRFCHKLCSLNPFSSSESHYCHAKLLYSLIFLLLVMKGVDLHGSHWVIDHLSVVSLCMAFISHCVCIYISCVWRCPCCVGVHTYV